MYRYRLYQFDIVSQIELPCEISDISPQLEVPDSAQGDSHPLTVHRTSLENMPLGPCAANISNGFIRSYPINGGVLFCLQLQPHCEPVNGHTGSFTVRLYVNATGDMIGVDSPAQGVEEAAYYLIGLALPVCMLQKGSLPLHAASAELNGHLVGIMGRSGAGKSTLLYQLMEQGARLGGDDLLPLVFNPSGITAVPSRSLPIKLRSPTLERYDVAKERCTLVTSAASNRYEAQQFWLPVEIQSRLSATGPLSALFILRPMEREPGAEINEPPSRITVQRLRGAAALSLLLANTHGLWAAFEQMKKQNKVALYAAVLDAVPLYQINYSKDFAVLPHLVQVITETINDCFSGQIRDGAQAVAVGTLA